MKIIELLNKIANGENLPKKIYCFNKEFCLNGNTYFGDTFTLMHYIQEEDLNDTVEIIEEEKKIPEKIKSYYDVGLEENCIYEEGKKQNNVILGEPNSWGLIIDKINEIIDYLKSKGE